MVVGDSSAGVHIRPIVLSDLDACRRLDGSVVSEYVWNMQQSTQRGDVSVLFSQVRLPRSLEVAYPAARDDLVIRLDRGDLMLIAEDTEPVGWISFSYDAGRGLGTVDHLIVTPERRRMGVGTELMRQAVDHARRLRARVVLTSCLAKNGPAVAFFRHLGMEFCGYNEHLYSEHEIALLFAYRL
ncbi:MAG: GNAT family N-acetyltransferase [Anaerolineae bacterium]|jgi:ribosomal protein S18 acetylase RimI-like enzyme